MPMEKEFTDILVQMGFPGLVILALAYGYSRKDKEVSSLNEKRVAESRETVKAMEQSTATIETLTEVLKERNK